MRKILVTTTPKGNFTATLEGHPDTRTVALTVQDAIYSLIIKHKALFDIEFEMDEDTRERAIAYSLP